MRRRKDTGEAVGAPVVITDEVRTARKMVTLRTAPRNVRGLMEEGPFMLKTLAVQLGLLDDDGERQAHMREPLHVRAQTVLNGLRVLDKHCTEKPRDNLGFIIDRLEGEIAQRQAAVQVILKMYDEGQ